MKKAEIHADRSGIYDTTSLGDYQPVYVRIQQGNRATGPLGLART
jgi:hypothetical protein